MPNTTRAKLAIPLCFAVLLVASCSSADGNSAEETTTSATSSSDPTPQSTARTTTSAAASTTAADNFTTTTDNPPSTTFTLPEPDPDSPAPGDLIATVVEQRRVVLEWNLVDDAETYQIYRDELLAGESTTGRFEDATTPGQTYRYSVLAVLVDGESERSSISVTTPPDSGNELSVKQLVQDAKSKVRSLGLGPHNYWTVTPICQACSFEKLSVHAPRGDSHADVWDLPAGHPGVKNPETVHDFLLDAIAQGDAVVAEFNQSGVATMWTVDGFGMSSDCFVFDTAPPEMVTAAKASGDLKSSSHCGYSGPVE